ncbi:MAG: endonuclease [Bacteroidota bacterium]
MFYNTENLYDPFNDTLVQDEEFLPDGARHWTYAKFLKKLNKLAQVIIAAGEWEPPILVGMCEVENRFVSGKITRDTPLKAFHYKVVHEESPDPRGVDVVLLYREPMAILINSKNIPIIFPEDSNQHTRDILYAKILLAQCDTLHVFVNHWPSKYGGLESSEKRRDIVANTLKYYVDSLMHLSYPAKILLMGDFNAEPDENCIMQFMNSFTGENTTCNNRLINLTETIPRNEGSYKFQGIWSSIDEMIISTALTDHTGKIYLPETKMNIFKPDFLLEKDESNMGVRPFRTYLGPSFHGGFSDHLPVFIDIEVNNMVGIK